MSSFNQINKTFFGSTPARKGCRIDTFTPRADNIPLFDIIDSDDLYSEFVKTFPGHCFARWLADRAKNKKDPLRGEILQILKVLYDKGQGLRRLLGL